MERPPVPKWHGSPPPDYWEAVPDPDWSIDPETVAAVGDRQGCRYSILTGVTCRAPIVAVAFRGVTQRPWGYCADHLYGRWIEGGRVVSWQVRKGASKPWRS